MGAYGDRGYGDTYLRYTSPKPAQRVGDTYLRYTSPKPAQRVGDTDLRYISPKSTSKPGRGGNLLPLEFVE